MKTLKFTTIAQKTYTVQFNEDSFFHHMRVFGIANLEIKNQVSLYLNNIHQRLFIVPFDSVSVQSIKYKFSREFKKIFNDINNELKFGL